MIRPGQQRERQQLAGADHWRGGREIMLGKNDYDEILVVSDIRLQRSEQDGTMSYGEDACTSYVENEVLLMMRTRTMR